MKSPYQLLLEAGFSQYSALCRFKYDRENTSLGAEKLAEMVRAIPGSTRVSTVSLDKAQGIAIFQVKLVSAKTPKEAFISFKENALKRFKGLLLSVEVGAGTIETKGNFILKEEKKPQLNQTNLGNYIGTLLQEELLLEVSVEELKRQYVDCDPQKLSEEVFNQIVQASNNKSNYATWLCKKVASEIINTEDLQLWSEIFEFFERYKQRFQKKDINQVKTAEDVHEFMNNYNEVRDAVEAKKATGQTQKVKDETDKCLLGHLTTSDGRKWLVYKTGPGQWDLERKIGSGTRWCTVASDYYFNYYMGPAGHDDKAYYIFINTADPKEKYQIHYGSNQCKGKEDREVDYSTDWVQDFYKYLEKVDGRTTWSNNAIRGRERRQQLEEMAKVLDSYNGPSLGDLKHTEHGGVKLYYITNAFREEGEAQNITIHLAAVFRDLGISDKASAISAAERFIARWDDAVLIKSENSWDVVREPFYGSSPLQSARNWLVGTLDTLDPKLEYASESTIDAYKFAAQVLGTNIETSVLLRTDKSLPGLESFKVKSEGNKTIYKIPAGPNHERAFLEADIRDFMFERAAANDLYICKAGDDVYAVTSEGDDIKWPTVGNRWSAHRMDQDVKILESMGLDVSSFSRGGLTSLKAWKDFGCFDGFKRFLFSGEKLEENNDEFTVGFSSKLYSTIHPSVRSSYEMPYLVFTHDKDLTKGVLILDSGWHHPRLVKPVESMASLDTLVSQQDLSKSGFPIDAIIKFYQKAKKEVPGSVEKMYLRDRNIADKTGVFYTLKNLSDRFQNYNIPYCRSWRGRFTVDESGIYGSWEQLGPAIKFSAPHYYYKIQNILDDHEGYRADVFIYYNRGIATRDWNCLLRVVNDNDNVVYYARRYGNNMKVSWSDRIVETNDRVEADSFETNYTQIQPNQARTRTRRAAAEQPAMPENAPAQTLESLQRYKVNSNNSEAVYSVPGEHATEALRAAGFPNLAVALDGVNSRNVLIYQVYPHKGLVSYVAIIYGGHGPTVVSGYPVSSTYNVADMNSHQWRRLTKELDNSVRTFQQCCDICQEKEISLPQALTDWLAYRQARG